MQKLTKADYRLLDALQNNTTLSQIDLAERSGMSRTSVWRRIREMEDAGLIESEGCSAESQGPWAADPRIAVGFHGADTRTRRERNLKST